MKPQRQERAKMTTTAQAIGALTAQVEALNQRLDRDRADRAAADAEHCHCAENCLGNY